MPTYLPVGAVLSGMAVTDGKGRFRLGELADGTVTLEAYAADVGRARRTDVRASAGRTTDGVKIIITRGGSEGRRLEDVRLDTAVLPGDIIEVTERCF